MNLPQPDRATPSEPEGPLASPGRGEPENQPPPELLERVRRYGQEHVLRWWDRLTPEGRRGLLQQCGRIDFALVEQLARLLLTPGGAGPGLGDLAPASVVSPTALSASERERLVGLGEEALKGARVAVVTVAGGLGTRLGAGPVKGMVAVGPVSGKGLFQLQAETILALGRRCGPPPHWFIMTSAANDGETQDCFRRERCFGLAGDAVHFFCQGEMPVVDDGGKVLLDAPDHIVESPDGHGGCLYALAHSGALVEMERLGVELVFYHQVDNPLVRIAEPLFLGLHVDGSAEVSSKALVKRDAEERLGHFVVDGKARLRVVEYSDMSPELQQQREVDGRLRFRFGSIAIHIFQREFLAGLIHQDVSLPFHRARKKVPWLDDQGDLVTPDEPNANKFERFIFDVLPWAERTLVVETSRDEFCPVKEPEGPDSPPAARAALTRRYANWLEAAGVPIERGPDGEPTEPAEVSPLVALSAEELARWLGGRTELRRPVYLSSGSAGEETDLCRET